MAVPPSQTSFMCPASSTMSSLPVWTSSLPSTVVSRWATCSASPWPVCSWSVPCTRTRSRPATRSAFSSERPASMRSDSPRRSASPPTSCSMVSDRISRAKGLGGGVKSAYGTVHGPASRSRLWLGSKTGSSGFHGTEFPAQSSSDPAMESSDGSCDGRVPLSSGGGGGGCGGDFPDDIDEDSRQELRENRYAKYILHKCNNNYYMFR